MLISEVHGILLDLQGIRTLFMLKKHNLPSFSICAKALFRAHFCCSMLYCKNQRKLHTTHKLHTFQYSNQQYSQRDLRSKTDFHFYLCKSETPKLSLETLKPISTSRLLGTSYQFQERGLTFFVYSVFAKKSDLCKANHLLFFV